MIMQLSSTKLSCTTIYTLFYMLRTETFLNIRTLIIELLTYCL